ncbi:META domain-containing protein [Futiania mangrovi]|uniref:META domain-containing protein n=1 Tax=Futiania mangrovi TaxID=2959716 RepID=A0A9J6PAA1_9PROT|nr:META domain-containing protein [Futiania mangrovii]MCP1335949.1 META domain-containing protein [Futiania mangrovii]
MQPIAAIRSATVPVAAALLALLLAACVPTARPGTPLPQPQPRGFVIEGELGYRERIALPPGVTALVTLTEERTGRVVAERRWRPGRQVPLPFALEIDPARLDRDAFYVLEGGILENGGAIWITDEIPVEFGRAATRGRIDVGTLMMERPLPGGFASLMRCGADEVRIASGRDRLLMTHRNRTYEMVRVRSGSGARYEAVNDPSTTYWSKGERATVAIRGRTLPECTIVRDDAQASVSGPALPFRAQGNEPGWTLDITRRGMTYSGDYGQTRVSTPLPEPVRIRGGVRYTARTEAGTLSVSILERACNDSMSGMPHPYFVRVAVNGRWHDGCGGRPMDLLTGDWIVTELAGRGVSASAQGTISFGTDGRVSGRAFCNRYNGNYRLTGETLTFSRLAATKMACPPAQMDLESRFFGLLGEVRRFGIASNGALVLHTDGGGRIVARRAD